uniref:Uncharacterized protein n=1 Tax=Solanum tuberosum TaxID=4113 RepID=M0ZRC4_SOLTU
MDTTQTKHPKCLQNSAFSPTFLSFCLGGAAGYACYTVFRTFTYVDTGKLEVT